MELKKQRLLFMLHPTEGEREEQVGVAGAGGERDEEESEDSGDVAGMKCRVPLKEVGRIVRFLSLYIDDGYCDVVVGFSQLSQCYGALC